MAQAVGIISVLVASDDLLDALAKQRQNRVTNTLVFSRITDPLSQITSESVALVESTQRQQTGVTADLSAGKISVNGSMSVEGENQLWYTVCHVADAPKGSAGFTKTQCSSTF